MSITGARPLGVTNCLNYGDPTRPEAFWQLQEAVARARRRVPGARAAGHRRERVALQRVAGGGDRADARDRGRRPARRRRHADRPRLRGGRRRGHPRRFGRPGPAGSAYAELAGVAPEDGPPALDLGREAALQRFIREAIGRGLAASAQDVAGGGLAVAVAEACIWAADDRGLGATLRLPVAGAPAVELFGESPSRLVVGCRPRHAPALVLLARQHGLPVEELGTVGGERLVIELAGQGATGAAEERGSRVADALDVPIDELRHAWEQGLARALGEDGFTGSLPEDR